MEKMLTDNVARRHFVIDADVQVNKARESSEKRLKKETWLPGTLSAA